MNWAEVRRDIREKTSDEALDELVNVAREMKGTPGFRIPVPCEGSDEETHLFSVLQDLIAGKYVEVGPAPQRMLAILVALYWLARDKKVFMFTGLSLGWENPQESPVPALRQRIGCELDVEWETPAEPASYRGQLILADYDRFMERATQDEMLLKDRECVAVVCEADLCLYDRRLTLFADDAFQGMGALYHGPGPTGEWFSRGGVFDAKDVFQRFDTVCPMTSYTSPRVREQMLEVYADVICGKGETRDDITVPAAAYRNANEKLCALAEDVAVAGGPSLVFYLEQRTGDALEKELAGQNLQTRRLASMKEMFSFISEAGEGEVGIFPGLPALEGKGEPESRPLFNIFIAEHFPFQHHHQKIFAFCGKYLKRQYGPYFYLSMDDAVTSVFSSEREHFRKTFGVVDAAEKWLSVGKSIRKWAAWLMLRKLYKLREKRFGSEVPIVMAPAPMPRQAGSIEPMEKSVRQQLDGSCFCGSGKPFRKCHGKE